MFTRYASVEYADVLDIKGSKNRAYTASLDTLSSFNDFKTDDGFLYIRIRAISSRVNLNYDGWPTIELAGSPDILNKHQSADGFTVEASAGNPKYGFATFMHKPIFVDHNNGDPKRTRGIIVDSIFRILDKKTAALDPYWSSKDVDPKHLPACEIELLLEIDAKNFPKAANAIKLGHIDGFSMGANVESSECNICHNVAKTSEDFCGHIRMKGIEHDYKTSSGKRIKKKSYENVAGVQFFEISCFPAGTPITTPDGPKPIETIEVGDYVLDHEGSVKRVTGTMEREFDGELIQIAHWGHGNLLLEATPEHPILAIKDSDIPSNDKTQLDRRRKALIKAITNNNIKPQWVPANELSVNDWLYEVIPPRQQQIDSINDLRDADTHKGRIIIDNLHLSRIRNISHREFHDKVYNLEVEDTHTYVANNFAVHNCVFLPADETAVTKEIIASVQKESEFYNQEDPMEQLPANARDQIIDKAEENYGEDMNPDDRYPMNPSSEYRMGPTDEYNPHGLMLDQNEMPIDPTNGNQIVPNRPNSIYDQMAPTQNDPRWSSQHTAENPLPQSMMVRAPEEIDTLRDESLCPVCGSPMTGETCDVCGNVLKPKGFDNPDLNKAQEIKNEMKRQEEQAAGPQPQQPQVPGPQQPQQQQQQPIPNKQQPTANVNNRMTWTPLVTEKTAARINKVEKSVLQPNTIVTNQPSEQTVLSDQRTPVTSAMLTAQRLMATAQRNHLGESMTNTKIADGATPPDGTSAKERVNVTDVGGFDEASNEAASAAQKQIDVTGIGGTGVEGVEPNSTEELPNADPKGNDSGFNTDKTTEDSGPTSTFGDSDGTEKAFTDPVTSDPFPASEDGVKKAAKEAADRAYYATYEAVIKTAYEDGTLEQQDQQGNSPAAKGGTAVKGVQPADPVGDTERVNLLEHQTSPENNSGPTKTWSGTDGNGVLKQQEPVTKEKQETGGVPTPDVKLHTGSVVRLSALKLAELEIELGLTPLDEKFNRVAALEGQDDSVIEAQIQSYSKVKQAGLDKLAKARTSGVAKMPSMFGKSTAAPNGFERIASDHSGPAEYPIDDASLDSALFSR